MKFSTLQRYILTECLRKGNKQDRKILRGFYETSKRKATEKYQKSIITKSIERLIDKELLMGYGRRTPHKWFITHIKLTSKGEKQALIIMSQGQEKLPFKSR